LLVDFIRLMIAKVDPYRLGSENFGCLQVRECALIQLFASYRIGVDHMSTVDTSIGQRELPLIQRFPDFLKLLVGDWKHDTVRFLPVKPVPKIHRVQPITVFHRFQITEHVHGSRLQRVKKRISPNG
jgi:hypothetical protein